MLLWFFYPYYFTVPFSLIPWYKDSFPHYTLLIYILYHYSNVDNSFSSSRENVFLSMYSPWGLDISIFILSIMYVFNLIVFLVHYVFVVLKIYDVTVCVVISLTKMKRGKDACVIIWLDRHKELVRKVKVPLYGTRTLWRKQSRSELLIRWGEKRIGSDDADRVREWIFSLGCLYTISREIKWSTVLLELRCNIGNQWCSRSVYVQFGFRCLVFVGFGRVF